MTSERLRPALLLVAVVVSAIVCWTAFDPVPHTGGDNAGYVSLAYGLLTTGSYTEVFDPEGLPHTKYPPVFPVLLALMIALGARTWVALKMAALVPTVAAVAATYLWSGRRLEPWGALAVSLLVSLSAAVVYYSHWILSDPLFVALTLAALYCLTRADEDWASGGGGDPTVAPGAGWLVAGVAASGLAYFTRSAGLPLVVALLVWLVLRRRWRALAASAAALGLPMGVWWLRGRGEGVAQYATEFWMVDPYEPALGTIGVFGLLPRVAENLSAYVLQHGPAGVVGAGRPGTGALGVVLVVGALAGWTLSVRRRVGPTELFLPLYAGLILVWPAVWGGDRFALPLYPLVFYYGALALAAATSRLPGALGGVTAAAALLALLLPAAGDWLESSRRADTCALLAERNGPWACYGPRVAAFFSAAEWSAIHLPPGAAVLTRKPRHFFASSGHPSRAFPFDENPEALLGLADALGVRYVLLDQWDGLAGRYVGGAVRLRPGAFCWVESFGGQEGAAQLLGILSPAARGSEPPGPQGPSLARCPADYTTPGSGTPSYSSSSGRIPLLDGLGS